MNDEKKVLFYETLAKASSNKNTCKMNIEKYNNLVRQVKEAKAGTKIVLNKHWLLKHYDVLTMDGSEHLVYPGNNSQIIYYVPLEHVFDILLETHQTIGHGGRDKMKKELQKKYKNITLSEIQTFLNNCDICLQKRKNEKRGSMVKPIVFSHFNRRCQVDLIDFQSQPDEDFKFIMVYQDHLTKFVILRALRTDNADEVANHMLDIFFIFGAPTILQSDNGNEFCNGIIEQLKILWPGLKILHGKSQPNQLDDSTEGTNTDIEDMLMMWMLDKGCDNWSKGLGYVQFMKNRTFHSGINRSPYEAMFGQALKPRTNAKKPSDMSSDTPPNQIWIKTELDS